MNANLTAVDSMDPAPEQARASSTSGFYRLAGFCALACVLVSLADISLTFVPLGGSEPGGFTSLDWFSLFARSPFFGMRNLGLLPNIPTQLLMLPLFLSLYFIHRASSREYAALALGLFLVGSAVYLSNNAAFPMLDLSARYAGAETQAQRDLLSGAAEAVLARGEDFTPGSFMGFLLGELAILVVSLVMLRARIFSHAAGLMGFIASLLLAVFTVWATFIPANYSLALFVAMLGGLASIAWYILTARGLFRLAHS